MLSLKLMDLSIFIQAPAYTELINVKSMDANDSEMELIQNFPRLPIRSNKNDPWKPTGPENLDIPKIHPAPTDPLRSMISSESYVKSLGASSLFFSLKCLLFL